MSNRDRYTEQHERILIPAKEILVVLDSHKLEGNESKVRRLLSMLAGRLKIHLVIEDKSVYPALLNDSDVHVRGVARKFKDEMGNIAEVFNNYLARWNSELKIKASRDAFTNETRALFAALVSRISREDEELYPLVA